MVDPFATSLAGFTLAVSSDRLLVEDPRSNSVLSLHPALGFEGEKNPRPFQAVEKYTVSDEHVEVTWRPVEGVGAVTSLSTIREEGEAEDSEAGEEEGAAPCAASRLQFQVRFTNVGDETAEVESFHPVCFPSEGPGACALGFEGLRTLASRGSDGPLLLRRLHGEGLQSAFFGTWFSASGSPTLLMGPLESGADRAVFRFAGVRGKMLNLRVDSPGEGAELAPGESRRTPLFLLLLGALDVNEELKAWSARLDDPEILDRIPDFQPSDELVEEEPPEEADLDDEPEVLEEELSEDLSDEDRELDKDEDEDEDRELDEDEDREEIETEGGADSVSGPFEVARPSRCSTFRRAMRATRGFQETGRGTWPRWASGRRYEPFDGSSARTRGYWRVEFPEEDS